MLFSRRSILAILCWTCGSSPSGSSLEGRIPCAAGSRTSWPTSCLCSLGFILVPDCRKRYSIFYDPRCCYRFLGSFSSRSMVPKMILRLGFVDLVDHTASSILARRVALPELSEPSGGAHPEFSYIPLSQCKLQAVRLYRTTACDRVWWNCRPLSWASFKLHQTTVVWRRFQSILVWRDPWFRQIA